MFNRTIIIPARSTHHYTTVTEKRAPTDESVALLKEMEQAARDKVAASIRLDGNDFNCVIQRWTDVATSDSVAAVHFELNGRRLEVRHSDNSHRVNEAEFLVALRDKLAARIAAECLSAVIEAGRWRS